jgi:hypothetical protein
MEPLSHAMLDDIALEGAVLDESRLLGISGGHQKVPPHSWTSADGGGSVIDDLV